jgi:DNA-directed RNA polymerase subunit RPC12/RpoP
MREVQFLYKCRHCGKIYGNSYAGEDFGFRRLVNAVKNIKEGAGYDIHLYDVHTCNKNSCGIADLIGYKMTDN